MTKALLGVSFCVLAGAVLLAAGKNPVGPLARATVASGQSTPTPVCTPLPDPRCAQGLGCNITAEWFRDNQNCPESGHQAIVIPYGAGANAPTLSIGSSLMFRVDEFKQFGTTMVGGQPDCDWNSYLGTARPFDDVTGGGVTLKTYSHSHILKANDGVHTYCYEVNFAVKGGPRIDPHIKAGGNGVVGFDALHK